MGMAQRRRWRSRRRWRKGSAGTRPPTVAGCRGAARGAIRSREVVQSGHRPPGSVRLPRRREVRHLPQRGRNGVEVTLALLVPLPMVVQVNQSSSVLGDGAGDPTQVGGVLSIATWDRLIDLDIRGLGRSSRVGLRTSTRKAYSGHRFRRLQRQLGRW